MAACSNAVGKKRGTPRLPIGKITNRTRRDGPSLAANPAAARLSPLQGKPGQATALSSRPATVVPLAPTASTPAQTPAALPDPSTASRDESTAFDRLSEKTITVKEAAYRLGKDEDTVRDWLKTGRLRGWQLGGRGCAVLVDETSLKAVLSCSLGCAR